MENQDKIVEQFKKAAENSENQDFPGMEKVWSRVDAKLDTKVFKKQNKNWQKMAVAASVVIVGIIAYQFLKTDKEITIPKNQLVITDSTQVISEKPILEENAIVVTESNSWSSTKKEEQALQEQINSNTDEVIVANSVVKDSASVSTKSSGYLLRGRVFDAIGVHRVKQDNSAIEGKKAEVQDTKIETPLIVIDGKTITNNKKSPEKILDELDKDEFETVYLKEPLYIINGIYYSEESLFGKTPTSPYAPLDKQEIKTIKILQGEEATSVYGKKGEKGVVIITTKTGKPVVLK
ncbi:hypothetical protein [Flavobacterium sp.]|uniref:hypothetical protein n=1 Tax=Flavobacterium sp. TaxID=239 RepID=UPI00374CDB0B